MWVIVLLVTTFYGDVAVTLPYETQAECRAALEEIKAAPPIDSNVVVVIECKHDATR